VPNKDSKNNSIPRRRFGRTEIQIPVLSLGGMRFQQSWKDLDPKEINNQQQDILQKIINHAAKNGMHHIETARHYGTSERQIGWAFDQIMIQKEYYKRKSHQIMILRYSSKNLS
jgi:predicted aldo/keto reductase-like oxidoreductase